jgi:hypothetical protein
MVKRRRMLAVFVIVLLTIDALFLVASYKRQSSYSATITHIGLDSTDMLVPISMRPAKLRAGKWDIDPIPTLDANILETVRNLGVKPLALVSLSPQPTYGQAISVIRSLKARRVCNVLIREGGWHEPGALIRFPGGPEKVLRIPPLVLCGSAVGDAGFSGTLPADGPFHFDGGG